ncbi:MAG: hypothetical protein WDZ91_09465 [Paenibacillaceae bacterium]
MKIPFDGFGAQLDFDYGDEEMMSRLCQVASDADGRPILQLGEATYRTVVISGMVTIRSTTITILNQFVQAGGKVIFTGEPPTYVDALPSGQVEILADVSIQLPFAKDALVAACLSTIEHDVQVEDVASGGRNEDIYCQVRRDESSTYVVLLNTNRTDWHRNVAIEIQAEGAIEEWFCVTGERHSVDTVERAGKLHFVVDFPPSGEHVYVIVANRDENLQLDQAKSDLIVAELTGPFAYKLQEPNICVLDMAAYRLNEGEWQAEREILKTDQALRDELGIPYRGGEMVQPWYAEKYLENHTLPLGKLQLSFSFLVNVVPEGPIHLIMERPERF